VIRRGLRTFVRRRCIVHLTGDDGSIRGVLKDVHHDCITVLEPEYLDSAEGPTGATGVAVIPRSQVAWLQMLEA
jgi:hypothetical protein